MLKKIEQARLNELLNALMGRGPLYAPVRDDRGVNFQVIKDADAVTLDFYNTALSPKSACFPQSEDMIRYRLGKGEPAAQPVARDMAPTVWLGVRPCDARSFLLMDQLFLGNDLADPYWQARREKTTIIGYAFDPAGAPEPADFYNTLGIGGADPEGSDVLMVRKDDVLLLAGITEKGRALLADLSVLTDATSDEAKYFEEVKARGREQKTRFFRLDPQATAARLKAVFDNTAFWEKIAEACISCGTCTFVCPTCHCFDIADETLFRDGVRKRFWDACMFTDFTLEASGHNPRPRVYQRLRQKVCHKYSYYVDRYGTISCVGCGRCTRSCPVNIDIYSLVAEAMRS